VLRGSFGQSGDEAGLAIYGERFAALSLVQRGGRLQLRLRHGWNSDRSELSETSLLIADDVGSSVELGFRVDYDGISCFCYRLADGGWCDVAPTFSAGAGKWVGARFGIYASGQGPEIQGEAVFSQVEVTTH
jgi:hypothetical protein